MPTNIVKDEHLGFTDWSASVSLALFASRFALIASGTLALQSHETHEEERLRVCSCEFVDPPTISLKKRELESATFSGSCICSRISKTLRG